MVKQRREFSDAKALDTQQRVSRLISETQNPFKLGKRHAPTTHGSGSTSSTSQQLTSRGSSTQTSPELNGRKRAVDFFEDQGEQTVTQANGQVKDHAPYIRQSAEKRQKLQDERSKLPISKHASLLREKIRDNSVIILLGETGSGKSTQLPQFLLQPDTEGCIAVTQPRRVAAINLAKRVAEERDVKLGHEVGYSIRFDNCSTKRTRIQYLTDGMLLIELLKDPLLCHYSTVILDEAHERTLLTDLLLGFMKALLKKRLGLRVVVMSATLDAERFSAFFDNAEVVRIEGRTFPVELFYCRTAQADYLDAVLRTVFQLHIAQPTGDVLVFLTGSDEIESLSTLIKRYAEQLPAEVPKMLVLPLYASLVQSEQARVFLETPRATRKVILATNIAETSITVPGVRYVIDAGLQKIKTYNPKIGFESLEVSPISQGNADQRTGRAGREAPGKCWRLYQESTYQALSKSAEPEIKRVELSQAILALKARGVDDVLSFPYIEAPSRDATIRALEHLYSLGALDDSGNITSIGGSMSAIPLTPALARVLIASRKEECVSEVIDIVSCLSVDGIFLDKSEKREEIAESRKRFESVEGDHMTLLNVVRAYKQVKGHTGRWCDDNFIDRRALRTVLDIRKQISQHMIKRKMTITNDPASPESILRAFLTGFIGQCAFLSQDGSYRTINTGSAVSIHPSSTLYGKKVEAIVYNESVFTTRLWVRGVSKVDGSWVRDASPAWTGRTRA